MAEEGVHPATAAAIADIAAVGDPAATVAATVAVADTAEEEGVEVEEVSVTAAAEAATVVEDLPGQAVAVAEAQVVAAEVTEL